MNFCPSCGTECLTRHAAYCPLAYTSSAPYYERWEGERLLRCVVCGGLGVHEDGCLLVSELRSAEHRGRMRGLQEAAKLYGRSLEDMVLVPRVDLQLMAELDCERKPPCNQDELRKSEHCLSCRVARWAGQILREGNEQKRPATGRGCR